MYILLSLSLSLYTRTQIQTWFLSLSPPPPAPSPLILQESFLHPEGTLMPAMGPFHLLWCNSPHHVPILFPTLCIPLHVLSNT